jgi:hypothetical protein
MDSYYMDSTSQRTVTCKKIEAIIGLAGRAPENSICEDIGNYLVKIDLY